MDPLPITRWLAERYGAAYAPAACELIRSYTNDVYLVRAGGERFVLKVYGLGWRTVADVRWEIDLLAHLGARGVAVAGAVPALDGQAVQTIPAPDGPRAAVLFRYAAGGKPQPPFGPALYERFGAAVAQLHRAADTFATPHRRRPLDTELLIDEPAALAARLLTDRGERAWLLELAGSVKAEIARYAAAGLDWGPVHGDATLDNLHVTEDGAVVLYDLDSAAPSWRAADLQGWAAGHAAYRPAWDAFHAGYAQVRPLPEVDRAAAPSLTLAWDIWGLQIDLERRILPQGADSVREYLAAQIAMLRSRQLQGR